MSNESKPAQRGSQKERVYAQADKILTMLSRSARLSTMQAELGMEDMPYPSFARLVKSLKDEAPDGLLSPFSQPRPSGSRDGISPPPEMEEKTRTADDQKLKSSQPQDESVVKSELEKVKKAAPRLRKKVPVVEKAPVSDEKGFNPAKWKDIEI